MSSKKEHLRNLKKQYLTEVLMSFERGDNANTIAEHVGTTSYYINKWLKSEGYKQRKSGKDSYASIARGREMHSRGWPIEQIAWLLNTESDSVKKWIARKSDPVRSGRRDSISVRGRPLKIFSHRILGNPGKVGGRKSKWIPRPKERIPESELPKISLKNPPPIHKKNSWWTFEEEAYVLKLLASGRFTIRKVYEKSRCSRRQQLRIWRKYRGEKGFPPAWPKTTPEEAAEIWKAKQEGRLEDAEKLEAEVEDRALEQAARLAELEARTQGEIQKARDIKDEIKELEKEKKKLSKGLVKQKELRETAEAIVAKRKGLKPPAKKRPRRVLEGSYEDEVLGLKVGSLVEPKKLGRPKTKRSIKEYADNGRYFVVSRDWEALKSAKPDELKLFAAYLTSKRFPARVERRGDQPKAYYENTWPKKIEDKWVKTVDAGLEMVDEYREKKATLRKKKMFSKRIAVYLASVYDGYRNKKLNAAQRKEAREDAADHWARLSKLERLVMVYDMKLADADGQPTTLGVDRSLAAKMLSEKAAKRAARKLTERRISSKKKAIRQKAGDVLALPEPEPEPEDEEDELAKMLAETRDILALPEGDEE